MLVNLSWMDGCLDSATRSRDTGRQRTARAPSPKALGWMRRDGVLFELVSMDAANLCGPGV